MLRKPRIRPGRRMAVVVAVGVLTVLLLWVATAEATEITVDGNCGEWNAGDYQFTDPRDTVDPQTDGYDIEDVYATFNASGDFFVRYDTYANIVVNQNSFTRAYFDVDNDSGTGEPKYGMGWDYQIYSWDMPTADDSCTLQEWTGSAWSDVGTGDSFCNGAWGSGTTCVEIFVSGVELGFGSVDKFGLRVYFDNADDPSDDSVQWDHDVPTAVELSSFTASSQGTSADEPGLTSLWPVALVSGVVVVSAGGLVLWRRKEPAP